MSEISNTFYRGLKEGMNSNPENFLQPTVHKESLTGRYFVNPDFFKEYGFNPHNKVNKRDIYLEKSLQWHYDQVEKKKTLEDYREDIREYYWFNKFDSTYVSQVAEEQSRKCKTCSAINHTENVLCWYCVRVLSK